MTPFDIFFNKYKIIDVNFFDISNGGFIQDLTTDNIVNNMRISVATWFYTLRNIATIILACILIYVGIRMVLSTVADEKAKYKKMLFDWICSLILIYVLQYIIIFTLEANNTIVRFLRDVAYTDMEGIIGKMALQASLGIGMGSLVAVVALCMIVFQTLAFFLAYINRMLKVAFLIIISPLISITYSIDKMGDGKAQALDAWLKEFVYTILIQPFHVLLYMAFVNTAMSLLTTTNSWLEAFGNVLTGEYNEIINAVLVILCLKFVNDGEKIIRKIFNFQDDSSKTSMAAGAAVGLATLNAMKKGAQIGTKAAGFVNKASGSSIKWMKALATKDEQFKKVKEKFDQTGLGKAMQSEKFQSFVKSDRVQNVLNKGKDLTEKAKKSRTITGIKKLKNKGKLLNPDGKLAKFIAANKNMLPKTLAVLGFAMSYATGTSGLMQAFGMGDSLKKGAEGFFEASGGELGNRGADALTDQLRADDEEYQDTMDKLADNEYENEQVDEQLDQTNKKIDSLAQRNLRRESDQTPKDALNAFESEWASIRERKKSSDESVRNKALNDERNLRNSNVELYDSLDKRAELKERKKSLADEKKKLEDTQKKIDERLAGTSVDLLQKKLDSFDTNSSKSKIEKAKADILKEIQNAMREKKIRDDGLDPSQMTDEQISNYNLTDEENEDAKAMQERMCMLMDRSVMKTGDDFNSRKMVLNAFGKENTCGNSLKEALESYKTGKRAEDYVNARDYYTKVGGEEEKFRQMTASKTTGQRYSLSDFVDLPVPEDTTGANG